MPRLQCCTMSQRFAIVIAPAKGCVHSDCTNCLIQKGTPSAWMHGSGTFPCLVASFVMGVGGGSAGSRARSLALFVNGASLLLSSSCPAWGASALPLQHGRTKSQRGPHGSHLEVSPRLQKGQGSASSAEREPRESQDEPRWGR